MAPPRAASRSPSRRSSASPSSWSAWARAPRTSSSSIPTSSWTRSSADSTAEAGRGRRRSAEAGNPARSGTLLDLMFQSLSDRFDAIFTRLRGRGRLSDEDIEEVLREIRLALLQADVNIRVVRTFVSRVRDQTVGAELSKSLQPAQQVIKIVHDELVAVLGGEALKITYASKPPTVVLLAGLQGS